MEIGVKALLDDVQVLQINLLLLFPKRGLNFLEDIVN
jgi:hypothetical protein